MKIVSGMMVASTIICMMIVPTYIGVKLNHPTLGILIGFILTILYIISIVIKRK